MRIATFIGDVRTVFPVAFAVAECGDWTLFDLPDGWRQTDPDLSVKAQAILNANSFATATASQSPSKMEDARAVIEARENADAG